MRTCLRGAAISFSIVLLSAFLSVIPAGAQSSGNSGSVNGTVTDPTGAVVRGATVTIQNPVSQYERTVRTDSNGHFQFLNVPFNPYHMTVEMKGFNAIAQDVDVRSGVPLLVPVKLALGTASETIQVTGEDLIENDPTFHTDVDREEFIKVPLESQSSSLSSLVTLSTSGRRRRLQRPFPRPRRSRVELVLHRRPADHRPAEQGLLQPDAFQLHPVARSDRRRAASRVRRQNQPRHRGHHPFRPGRHHAYRHGHHLLWHLRLRHRRA